MENISYFCNMKNRTIAAILAGGTGSRMGGECPKQFLPMAGRKVIEWTVDAFERNANVDEIIIVVLEDYISAVHTLVESNRWKKVTNVVKGGKERYLSTLAALSACETCAPTDKILIHDAARPLITQQIIDAVVESLDNCSAVAVGVPSIDTIWQVASTGGNTVLAQIPNRNQMRCAQTPQAFHMGILRSAYRQALQEKDIIPTDDCGMVMHYCPQTEIHVVDGDSRNFKITYPEDIKKAELLFSTGEK